jgi:hypothetical protein
MTESQEEWRVEGSGSEWKIMAGSETIAQTSSKELAEQILRDHAGGARLRRLVQEGATALRRSRPFVTGDSALTVLTTTLSHLEAELAQPG